MPMIGEIRAFAGFFTVKGWLPCEGQLLSIAHHQALFAVIGTSFGGDAMTNFALPDLRGRFAIQPMVLYSLGPQGLGGRGGKESHTLTVEEMPGHRHAFGCTNAVADLDSPVGRVPGRDANVNASLWSDVPANGFMGEAMIHATGEAKPVPLREPYQALQFHIAIEGEFPARS